MEFYDSFRFFFSLFLSPNCHGLLLLLFIIMDFREFLLFFFFLYGEFIIKFRTLFFSFSLFLFIYFIYIVVMRIEYGFILHHKLINFGTLHRREKLIFNNSILYPGDGSHCISIRFFESECFF